MSSISDHQDPNEAQNDLAQIEAERRILQSLENNETTLDLSGLELTSVPNSIGQLSNLTQLYLFHNQLTEVPKELGQLSNLTRLDLFRNQLTEVPKELGQLSNLTQLSLDQNQITEVPEELGQLSNLTRLYLYQNQLTEIPKELGKLSNLTQLSLNQNQLMEIPEELGELSNLTRFSLSQNQLRVVPKELGKLSNLTQLSLDKNQLRAVPKELGQLSNLTQLSLNQNQLAEVPKELGQFSNLMLLDLSQNQITEVPKELGQLFNLTRLDLSQNQITEVPKELGQLSNLMLLDLSQNQITEVPKELGQLSKLTQLFLHNNKNLSLSNEILGPTREEVKTGKTPINPQDILNYYFRTLTKQMPLNEAKLILVGFGGVGKTCLVNRLISDTFDPHSQKTEGIHITLWPIRLNHAEDIKLHVWDFGGQEIMHSTHQFFLTERSLYLLVLNGRQGHEDEDAEYWLELIQSFGGNSPVIVVLNKVEEQPFDVNRRALLQKFPSIHEFIQTDCKTNKGLQALRDAIDRETDRLEHLRDAFPGSWVTIKQQLSTMPNNYISFEKYREICHQNGETDFTAQDSLAVHLHSLGIALNYKNDARLRDTHVLNPHWVTNGIYKLINKKELTYTHGELATTALANILDTQNYPPERHGFLLELMRKFELCFPFAENDNRYLIPDLLDKQQPAEAENFNLTECLNFRYEYPILPEGLLPRFIVRTHVLSTQQLRWRTGVILTFEGNCALVKGDRQTRSVTISVEGPIEGRRRLLAVIRSDFDRIHSSFKFDPKELVPVPEHPTVTVSYNELLSREKQNRKSIEVFLGNDKWLDLKVQDLLNGIDIDGSRNHKSVRNISDRPLRLFYSYSHKDETLRNQLETHLKILERQDLILPWHDREIPAGNEWEKSIDDNLNLADIILLLISADFVASDYCYEIELERAMERHDQGEATIIPIILRPADWSNTTFSKLQVFPQDAKPVTQWDDRDAAWLNVEAGIKQAIENIKGKRKP